MPRESSETTAAAPTSNASAVLHVGFCSQLISMPTTPSKDGSKAVYVDSDHLNLVCLETRHLQAQFQFNQDHQWQRFIAQRNRNPMKLLWKMQKSFSYQPKKLLNLQQPQIAALKTSFRSKQPHPAPSSIRKLRNQRQMRSRR